MAIDIASTFAQHLARTQYADLPHAAIAATQKSLLDTWGVTAAGSGFKPSEWLLVHIGIVVGVGVLGLLAGKGSYVDDKQPQGLVHVAFRRSDQPHARIAANTSSGKRIRFSRVPPYSSLR